MLQLADRLFGLPHAVSRRVDLAAEEIGILAVDRHLRERLNLALESIELDRDELGVLLGAAEVVEAQLVAGHAVLKRPNDSFVAALRGLETLAQIGDARVDLLLVHRLEKSIERRLRHQQPEKQPQQPIETRSADLF